MGGYLGSAQALGVEIADGWPPVRTERLEQLAVPASSYHGAKD
jgi:hypothetical protein